MRGFLVQLPSVWTLITSLSSRVSDSETWQRKCDTPANFHDAVHRNHPPMFLVDLVLSADRKIVAKREAGNHKVIGVASPGGNEGCIDGASTFVICSRTGRAPAFGKGKPLGI